jgi:outer membrane biosynthesis protein TonB
MNIRLNCLGAAAAIALTACGPAEDPAANVGMNDVNAFAPAADQNAAVTEALETNTAAHPVADSAEKPAAKATEPKKAAPAKPAPAPEPKPVEPESPDPTCAPEHRAAGHC